MKKSLILLLVGAAGFAQAGEVRLAADGKAKAEIVIAKDAPRAVRFAAKELKAHLDAITGADFQILSHPSSLVPHPLYPIFIGACSEAEKYDALEDENIVIDVSEKRTVLVGRDEPVADDRMPDRWEARGSLNATYGFLRERCGVEWLDPTEAGTVIPKDPSLKVKTGVKLDRPFVRARDMAIAPEEWDKKRSPKEWQTWLETAYPATMAKGGERAVDEAKKLFGIRMRLGGGNGRRHANHSFYWCYDRFWDTNNVNFIAFHPEWFSRHKNRKDKLGMAEDGIFSGYDLKKRPGQMCYSNPEFLKQTIVDVRAYFDVGGYTNRYSNQGVPCNAKHPVASWGRDVYCLEPMDNGAYCECERCTAMYDMKRKDDSGFRSDYWFTFVNAVAREIRKSHPGKKISTLAYGNGREGLPTFPIEDNVIVHFCWDSNREPNRQPLFDLQKDLLRQWHERYPKQELGLWFYNGFPHESGTWFNYLPMPGFFGRLCSDEFKFIKRMNVCDTVFCCGAKDDFESFLTAYLMWDPDADYGKLKDRFFGSYGPAAKGIREFYDIVEERYCTIENWKGFNRHPERGHSWGFVIDGATMRRLRTCMKEAEAAVAASGSDFEKARVRNWRVGYWNYMCAAKVPRKEIATASPGVKIVRTEFFGMDRPAAFAEEDVLKGRPFSVSAKDGSRVYFWAPKGENADPKAMTLLTDDAGFHGFLSSGNATGIVYRCDVKVPELKRFRLTTDFDPARKRFFLDLVGWKDGKAVTLCKDFFVDEWTGVPSGVSAFVTYDFHFAPSSVPRDLEAIGLVDNFAAKKFNSPRFVRFEASGR